MKALLRLSSIIALSLTNALAGTVHFSKLTTTEKEFISESYDDNLIKYDPSTDQVILDENFEKELRKSGILQTEDGVKSTVCTGGGGGEG